MPTVSRGLYRWLLCRGATLEDFADRLNHFWTFGLLLLFACIVSWKHSYNSPIQCWAPAQFTYSFISYTHEHCWNSHFIQYPHDVEKTEEKILKTFPNASFPTPAFTRKLPTVNSNGFEKSDSLHTKISTRRTVYQWVPVILCFQALLFKLPNLLMYILHGFSGISFDKIAGVTSGYENMNLTERIILSQKIGRYIFNWCLQFRNCLPWRLLTLFWLIVKSLYCINIIVQMHLLDAFLSVRDHPLDNPTSYGQVISGIFFKNNATIWKMSPAFPKQVYCNFEINQLQNVQRWSIQCDLPVNYFNEYVYMFIWVWFLIVAIVTYVSLIVWLLRTSVPMFRKRYITKAIALANETDFTAIRPYDISKFCDIIGEDGVMVLKLAAANSSEILVADIVGCMWKFRTRDSSCQQPQQILSLPEVQLQLHPTAPTSAGIPLLSTTGQQMRMEAKKTD